MFILAMQMIWCALLEVLKKLKQYTDSLQTLTTAVIKLYEQHCHKNELIRRIGVSFEDLVNRSAIPQEVDFIQLSCDGGRGKERQVHEAMLSIKEQFGKKRYFYVPLALQE